MGMTAKIPLSGLDIKLKASGLVPRLYRSAVGSDMAIDMQRLIDAYKRLAENHGETSGEESVNADEVPDSFTAEELTIFENAAWAMAKAADRDAETKTVPDDPDEWLDSLPGVFDIYKIMPTVIGLWNDGQKITSTAKKK